MIRKATILDAERITEIQVHAWKESYRHFLPEDILGNFSVHSRVDRWKSLFAQEEERIYAFDVNEVVHAFIHFTIDSDLNQAEIVRLYVDPKQWRSGFGKKLIDFARVELNALRIGEIILWVAEENHAARKFYEEQGFEHIPHITRKDAFSIDGSPLVENNQIAPDVKKGQFLEVQYLILL